MKKLTIEEMHLLKKNRGGKCLSINSANARKKVLWESSEGYQWKEMPYNREK